MDSSTVNTQLQQYYEGIWPDLVNRLSEAKGLELPQLIATNPEYIHAPIRLMIIGQQTVEWGTELKKKLSEVTVPQLMEIHRKFNNAEFDRKSANGWFWRRSYRLQELVNPNVYRHGFLYSNLMKVAQNRGRPTPEVAGSVSSIPLLSNEIKIVDPTVAVFFVGTDDYYESILKRSFPDDISEPIIGFDNKQLVMLRHARLPPLTFRTFHPQGMGARAETLLGKIAEITHNNLP